MLSIFSISGRIGRGTWWMVTLGSIIFGLIIGYVFEPELPATSEEVQALLKDKVRLMALWQEYMTALPILLLTAIVNNWLFITSGVQRLHDRGSSGWRILLAYVPLLLILSSFYVFAVTLSVSYFIGMMLFGIAGAFVAFVWMIVELGMLSGDDFENDYGNPPNDEARKLSFEKEMRQLRGEPEPATASFKLQQPAAQPAMAFAAAPTRPSFGKR